MKNSGRRLRSVALLWVQIQNSRFRITLGTQLAKGRHKRTCGTRKCSPPPGGGCGLLCPFGRKFRIQNSRFIITYRAAACGVHASSATNCGPPPGGGCGPPTSSRSHVQYKTPTTAARSVLTDRSRHKDTPRQPAVAACSVLAGREAAARRASSFFLFHPLVSLRFQNKKLLL